MPSVPASFLAPIVHVLPRDRAEALLSPGGLTPAQLFEADRVLDLGVYDRLVLEAARVSGDPAIGLALGHRAELRQLGLVAWILQNAATVAEALAHYRRYNAIVCSGLAYDWTVGETLRFTITSSVPGREVPRPVVDAVVVSLVRLIEQLSGAPVPVRALDLPWTDADSAPYEDLLGVRPRWGRPVAVSVDPEVPDRRVVYADPHLLAEFQAKADRLLPQAGGRAAEVRRLLHHSPGQAIGVAEAARRLALGVRTLQSHLKAEGTTFQALSDQVRRQIAEAQLLRSQTSVGEVAWLLGYSEQSAFQAAFKRWTGVSPGEFRKRNREL